MRALAYTHDYKGLQQNQSFRLKEGAEGLLESFFGDLVHRAVQKDQISHGATEAAKKDIAKKSGIAA